MANLRMKDMGETLAGEHAHLEQLFDELVGSARCEEPQALRARWSRFETDLTAHLALEESRVLPAFEREYPEEARAILADHGRIRSLLEELGLELELHCLRSERVSTFIDQLRAHARREERLMYPWASRTEQPGLLGTLGALVAGVIGATAP